MIIAPSFKRFARHIVLCSTCLLSVSSYAHFQEIIPNQDFLDSRFQGPLRFDVRFTHPMSQGPVMNMTKPLQLKVLSAAGTEDLLSSLTSSGKEGSVQWQFEYQPTAPGDLSFYIEPAPYWEPDEGKMIIHYTKVIVDGFAQFDQWDKLVGLPVEIEPLTRPYSLWVGNTFSAVVRENGVAVPFAEIEVEWRNDGTVEAPSDSYITQVIKADANGTFNYSLPRAGWWGFAALREASYQLTSPNGDSVPVELGGLIWINAKVMD